MRKLTFILFAFSNFINLFAVAQSDTTKAGTITVKVQDGGKANNALIIIDGKKQYTRGTEALKHLNPEDIASIDILKDTAATKQFGEEGKAGVILIKTRSGKLNTRDSLHKENVSIGLTLKGKLNAENILYILDGTALEKSEIEKIKPADIESVKVLKDLAAVKLYGDKAKDGVIIITTKSYASKKPKN